MFSSSALLANFAQPRWLGITAGVAIFLAGIFDYLEDRAILAACRGDAGPTLFPVSYGLPKWILYFSALGLVAFCLIVYRSPVLGQSPTLSRTFPLVAGILLALSASLGIPGAFASFAAFVAILAFLLVDLVRHRPTIRPQQ